MFDSDERVVLQTARDASWQDPLTRLGLSVTPQIVQLEAPTVASHAKRDFSSIVRRCGTCTDCGSSLH